MTKEEERLLKNFPDVKMGMHTEEAYKIINDTIEELREELKTVKSDFCEVQMGMNYAK